MDNFDFKAIRLDMIQKHESLAESRLKPKKSRFGTAGYYRQFKRVKPTGFTRVEPPILKQTNPFKGESSDYAQNLRFKAGKRPTLAL